MVRLFLILITAAAVFSQVSITGNFQFTKTHGDAPKLNDNTRADNPFHRMRGKLFFFHALADDIELDLEFALDEQKRGEKFWLHGFSVNFLALFGSDLLNVKIGKLPMNIGSFAARANETENALIGAPLMYGYRTLLDWKTAWDGNSQRILRDKRDPSTAYIPHDDYSTASPIAYEICWDYGVNINGFYDWFDYSLMLTQGSLSNPDKNKLEHDDIQFSGRLSFFPVDWLTIGFSGARNRYLSTDVNIPAEQDVRNYYQTIYAVDLTINYMFVEWISEVMINRWDNINVEGFYEAQSAYTELNVTMPFLTDLRFVSRFDMLQFNQIKLFPDSPREVETWWDDDVMRLEVGLNYAYTRNVLFKGVYQHWMYDHYPVQGFSALQLLVRF